MDKIYDKCVVLMCTKNLSSPASGKATGRKCVSLVQQPESFLNWQISSEQAVVS